MIYFSKLQLFCLLHSIKDVSLYVKTHIVFTEKQTLIINRTLIIDRTLLINGVSSLIDREFQAKKKLSTARAGEKKKSYYRNDSKGAGG